MLIIKNLINTFNKNKLLYVTFIFILTSINISPHYFFNFNLINLETNRLTVDINFIINIIRFITPIILATILLIINKNLIKKNFFKNYFINIYIFYFIVCIISSVLNFKNIKNNIFELYFIIIIPVIIFFIFISSLNIKKVSTIYLIKILFISLLIILFLVPIFYNFNFFLNIRNAPIYNPDLYIMGVNTIKSTGLSRLLLIVYIFFFLSIIHRNNYKYIILIVLTLFNILIFSFESRTSYYFLIFVNCLIFFSKSFKKINLKIIIFIFLTSIGYIFFYSASNSFSLNNILDPKIEKKTRYTIILETETETRTETYNKDKHKDNGDKYEKRILSLSNKTSGRTDVWIKLFEREKSPLLIGYGIERDKNIFGITISNGAFYSYISAGILGLFCYFTLIILSLKNIFFYLNKYKKNILNINNFYQNFSVIIIFFLILRSLVETSFMFFGIDMILFIISNTLILKKTQK